MIASKIRTQENLKETKQNLTLTKKKKNIITANQNSIYKVKKDFFFITFFLDFLNYPNLHYSQNVFLRLIFRSS